MKNDHKKILVTGGAGYIGSHVCKALAKRGYLPVTYDNLCSGNSEAVQWGPLETGDVRDRARLAAVMDTWKPGAIIHLAALIQVGESVSNPLKYYDNNVFGSLCLLEEACAHDIRHMVFSSTAAVYGLPGTDLIGETSPLKPINPYGQTKLAMENMIRDHAAAYGLNFAILRYFNAAGADPETETGTAYKVDTHLIPLLMRVASGLMEEIKVYGTDYDTPDGTAIRDYIHVTDLAEARVSSLEHIMREQQSVTLNLGTSKGYSVREVIETARSVTNHRLPAANDARRSGDPAVLVADASRARSVLNWVPRHSDLQTIVKTAWLWKLKQKTAFSYEQKVA